MSHIEMLKKIKDPVKREKMIAKLKKLGLIQSEGEEKTFGQKIVKPEFSLRYK